MYWNLSLFAFTQGFALIDHDKDGIIGKKDLEFIYDQVGKLVNEKELDAMLAEIEEPLNFTQFLLMFASRMQGGGTIKFHSYIVSV